MTGGGGRGRWPLILGVSLCYLPVPVRNDNGRYLPVPVKVPHFRFRSVMTGGRKFYTEGRGCSLTLPYGPGFYFRPLLRHIVKAQLQ